MFTTHKAARDRADEAAAPRIIRYKQTVHCEGCHRTETMDVMRGVGFGRPMTAVAECPACGWVTEAR